MPTRRGRRIVLSWFALVAALLITFAPTLTKAMASTGGLPWETLCSAANATADAHGKLSSSGAPHAFEHCSWCALQAGLAPPPASPVGAAVPGPALRAQPPAFTRAPRGNAVWATAQPRAPPRFV